jgi:F0F1-type ATP synthase assembly protein I
MSVQRIETLTWVLIYGGLLGLSMGWFVTPRQGPWGELMIGGGLVATVAGIVLIVVRSKMKP